MRWIPAENAEIRWIFEMAMEDSNWSFLTQEFQANFFSCFTDLKRAKERLSIYDNFS